MSKRILVMEDEKDNRQIIRDMLGGIGEIIEAEDAEQALAGRAGRGRWRRAACGENGQYRYPGD